MSESADHDKIENICRLILVCTSHEYKYHCPKFHINELVFEMHYIGTLN
jgi:hypothetical protein